MALGALGAWRRIPRDGSSAAAHRVGMNARYRWSLQVNELRLSFRVGVEGGRAPAALTPGGGTL